MASDRVEDAWELRKLIRRWASNLGVPVRVYLFGSRLKGTHRPDSDLDIAVESLRAAEDYTAFFYWWKDLPHEEWRLALQSMTGLIVDLQHYDPQYTENLKGYLAEASEVVFETSNQH